MRNPRIDPQKGDVLEHFGGERRVVRARIDQSAVRYANRDSNMSTDCSIEQWQDWAKQTSILDFGADRDGSSP
jgi:hypothetical protein